jgi:hypothetical protein
MKLADKLNKVDEDLTVSRLDNGYTVEVRGEDEGGDWETIKVVCTELDEVVELLVEFATFPRR